MSATPATPLHYARGELIFSEGSEGRDAYIVLEGEVNIVKTTGEQVLVLKTIGPGELFGEMALITSNPRAASAVAKTEVVLEVLDQEALAARMGGDPAFMADLMRRLASMVPELQSQLIRQHAQDQQEEKQPVRWLSRWRRRSVADDFAPDRLLLERLRPPPLVGGAVIALCSALVAAIAWSALAKTEIVVSGHGKLVSAAPNMVVQSFDQATIKEIRVREGDSVRRGDLLGLLDPTVAESDLRNLRQQLVGTEAQIARIVAEQQSGTPPRLSADAAEDAQQRALLIARRQQYQASSASYAEEVAALEKQLDGRRRELEEQERQLKLAAELTAVKKDQYEREREAYQRDGVYKLQYLDAARSLAGAERDTTAARAARDALERQLAAKRAAASAFASQWQADSQRELASLRRDAQKLNELLAKQGRTSSLVELRAPADGTVQAIRAANPGTVIRPAETIMEIVPEHVAREFEVEISPADVGQIKLGDPVQVRLDAMPSMRHGVIRGQLSYLSADAVEPAPGRREAGSSYRARVRIDKVELHDTPPSFSLRPGMTATADIHVGKRAMIAYLFYPVARAVQGSFREP